MLYPELAEQLLEMERIDQEMRSKNLLDPEFWDETVDFQNTVKMMRIWFHHKWPTISMVGREASHSAWLIVQHADHDPTFQQLCLHSMMDCPEKEIIKEDVAYLMDRVRVNTDRPQIFGTQFTEVDGKFIPKEIEDPEQVDERRHAMGLGTLAEAIREMEEKYRKP